MRRANFRRLFPGLTAAAILSLANPAWSEALTDGGVNADQVVKVLQDRGFQALVGKDSQGNPKIHSSAEGSGFDVYFYSCKHAPLCASLQFSSSYHVDGGMKLETINGWSAKTRFGRAYLDEVQDPFVEMDLDVEHGYTTEAISNNVDTWLAVRTSFLAMIHCASKPTSETCRAETK